MNVLRISLAMVSIMACSPSQARAGTVVLDTYQYWNGLNGVELISNDGPAPLYAFGQSFTAPAGVGSLESFSFWLKDRMNSGPVRFSAYLIGWDGRQPTGPLLYTSGPVTTMAQNSYEQCEIRMAPVPVQPGSQYLAFFTTLGAGATQPGTAYVGDPYSGQDLLPGGQAWSNYSTNLADVLQGHWFFAQPDQDLAFRAEFSVVPEPSPLVLLFVGWACYWGFRTCVSVQKHV
jgi:hypothetical protein